MAPLERITKEIIDLHDFFTDWFNGSVDISQLESALINLLHPNFIMISPNGVKISKNALAEGFTQAYGINPSFKIQIRDVAIHHMTGTTVFATYTEWQRGAQTSEHSNNGRISSVVIDIGASTQWIHLHETWLPEVLRSAKSFDF